MLAGEERVKVKVRRCTGRNLEAAAELLGSVKIRWQAPGAAAAAIAMTERFARIVYSKRKYQRCLSSGRSMLSFNRATKRPSCVQKIFDRLQRTVQRCTQCVQKIFDRLQYMYVYTRTRTGTTVLRVGLHDCYTFMYVYSTCRAYVYRGFF